jgi:hypothetical protein
MTGQFPKQTLGSLYLGLPIQRPFPVFDCLLYLDPASLVKLGDFNAITFRIESQVPDIPALNGLTVRIQAARLQGQVPFVTVKLTNAVDLTIGR